MENVRKRFGATVALAGVDLAVHAGEVHALIGENGAGKSTLMKILAGALRPDDGRIWLDGQPFQPRTPADGRRAGVAMIYQELSLAPQLSVMENVLLGCEPTRGPFVRWGEVRRRAAAALAQLGQSDLSLALPVARLSAGQQQMVEIARAVAVGCRVLILDEPTSSLGQPDVLRLFELVRRLRAAGVAILYISHVLDEVRAISDRFTVLRDGRAAGGGVTAESRVNDIVALMIGRSVGNYYPRTPRTAGDVVVAARDLAGVRLPLGASFELRRGEVLGVGGLMGAGRTELLRAIFGLDAVRRGTLRVLAWHGPAKPHRRWLSGAGMLSEDRAREGLAGNLDIADNLTLARLRGLGPLGLLFPRRQERAAGAWIDALRVQCASPRQAVATLSGGNQQKVALARLLHADVDVLLLDEPTRGIDVGSKTQVYELIDRLVAADPLRKRPPRAVLFISSHLPELLGVCDRIAVMHRGRLGEARPVSDWTEHGLMCAATGVEGDE